MQIQKVVTQAEEVSAIWFPVLAAVLLPRMPSVYNSKSLYELIFTHLRYVLMYLLAGM